MNLFTKLQEMIKPCSHKNMLLVVGSNGNQQPKQLGIISLEFRSRLLQQIISQEIELLLFGLVLPKEVSCISQPTLTLIWSVQVMPTITRTSLIKTDTLNGSLSIMDIQRRNLKPMHLSNGVIPKISYPTRMLTTIMHQNSSYLLEEISISQDIMVKQGMSASMLVKEPSKRELISLILLMRLDLKLEQRHF